MITEGEIEMLAKLSKLRLTEEEKERMIAEMSDIVAFADTINQNLSTGREEIVTDERAVDFETLRADEVEPSFSPEELLANAESENDYFLVRRNSTK